MVVYLLYSNWMHNGDNAVNEVIGVYDCLQKAQQTLADCINLDLKNRSFKNVWCDTEQPFETFCIPELANMDYTDPNFKFEISSIRFWNGDEEDCCEDYLHYDIEQRTLF